MTEIAYLNVEEFAELHSVDPQTVRRWAREEKLPHQRVKGNQISIPEIEGGVWVSDRPTITQGRPKETLSPNMEQAKLRKELALARRYEHQLDVELKKFILAVDVRREWMQVIAEVKNQILGFGSRMSAKLEGRSAAQIEKMLNDEAERICQVLASQN